MNNNTNKPPMDIPELVKGLKTEDARNKRITRSFQWLLWIIIPFYAVVFFVLPEGESDTHGMLLHRVMGVSYIVAFVIFALFFRSYYKDYKMVDYSLPTLQMLKKAAYRYKLFHRRMLYLLVPIFLIDLNTCIFFVYDFKYYSTAVQNILFVQAFFLPMLAISFGLGTLIWYKRQKPLRENALLMIEDIEGE